MEEKAFAANDMPRGKVLIADHDRTLGKTMVKLFEKMGCSAVYYAASGAEAIEKIEKSFYELIILDAGMPDINAVEVLYRIRKLQGRDENSSIVLITGYAGENVPVEMVKLGVSDYIMKPFEPSDFVHSIENSVKITRAEKEMRAQVRELAETNRKLKQTLEELKKAQNELLRAERLAVVGKIAGSVGHELLNPLSGLKNIAYYLKKKADKEDENFVGLLSKGIDAANRIVADLLDYSSELTLEKANVPLEKALAEALESLGISEKIKVRTEIAPDAREIYADPRRIKHVFINVFANAVEAMSSGGDLRITVDRKGAAVRISVADTGRGMRPEEMKQIFDPLYTTKAKGVGLGLSIVQNIVGKHGGSVEVESQEDKGSRFTIVLPDSTRA